MAAAYAAQTIAGLTGLRTFSIDYRMPPDHPYPAGLDDTVEAYRFLLERYAPERIAVHGSSAGGGLAGSFVLKARDVGLPLPGACVLMTPEADLTETGDTFETNAEIDVVLLDRKDLPSAGAGETPIVGLAPAVGNAIFDACGIRLRSLPMVPDRLKL